MSSPAKETSRIGWRDLARAGLGLVLLITCASLIVDSWQSGFSRFLSMMAIIQSNVGPSNRAVVVTPKDPEAHYTRGLSLLNAGRLPEALGELREATRLRPYHYYEWLDLGLTLDRLGNSVEAESAMRKSISLAPSFAQPHWQLGNLLFRLDRYSEAFEELRKGARSNPNLTDGFIRLAWAASNGDPDALLSLVRPVTKRNHIDVARFLATQGRGKESFQQVIAVGEPDTEEEKNLLKQTVALLLGKRDFVSAFEVWKATHAASATRSASRKVINGDFVDPVLRDDPGFGWQLQEMPNVSVSIDATSASGNGRSICVEFGGDISTEALLINQIVLVEPGRRYSLDLMSKTENLVTGGSPSVAVFSMAGDPPKLLGLSTAISSGTNAWTRDHLEFYTEGSTGAVLIALQRRRCGQAPCPVFGKVWLSDFELKLN